MEYNAMSNINLEPKLVGNIEGNFYVPDYQRGYRWKEEVEMLLNDIHEVQEGKNYSLQPIVVRKLSEKNYELIDGQQRLTTIYIILKYIKEFLPKSEVKFSIDYQTRSSSKIFLESIDFKNTDILTENIDTYFFNEATKTIIKWFGEQDDESQTAIELSSKLNRKIRVIWYEVDSTESSVSLFTRLNIGRILLTNAELVKALFLSRNNGIDDRKQLEIATEWDIIEKELHNDSLWFFITNENPNLYPTRIELLFDLMADKKGLREKYFTFFHFDNEIKKRKEKADIWTDIVRYFQRLKEWYENIDLYHKIGYLVASESENLQSLISKSNDMTKTVFQDKLNLLIANSIDYDKDYCELSYENKTDYGLIEKLLLLFNVETIRKKSDETMRFPFDKHKQEDWSLEHIHAQQSQGMNKREQWVDWLNLHEKSLMSINCKSDKNIIQDIENAINDEKLTGDTFSSLFNRVTAILTEEGSIEYTHSLSNLALLEQSDNSALNNSTFDVKRNKILEMDKTSDYIPVCTRHIFLKYYTPSESNQVHFWGKADRDGYIAEMDKVLKMYLKLIQKEIKL
jgi:uncharacterized protein with ParB-like and HNH nuclease domain